MYICTGFTTCICPAFYAAILLINKHIGVLFLARWRKVLCRTYDHKVVGSMPGRVAITWLLLEFVCVCVLCVNYLGIQPTTEVNSAFHPSGVGKSSTGLLRWG